MDKDSRMIVILAAVVLVLAAGLFLLNKPSSQTIDPNQKFPALTISTGNNKLFGTGPIKVVEFTDYLCPYCRKFALETEPQIRDKYAPKITYFVRYFPVHGDPSLIAANGALCAAEQGALSSAHTIFFEVISQFYLDPQLLKTLAADMGLDSNTFNSCVDSRKYYPEINTDASAARTYGLTGTPTIMVVIEKNTLSREEAAKRATKLNLNIYEDDTSYTFAIIGYRTIETFDLLFEGL